MRMNPLAVAAMTLLVALSGCVEDAKMVPLGDVNAYEEPKEFDSLDGDDGTATDDATDADDSSDEDGPVEGNATDDAGNSTQDGAGNESADAPAPTATLSADAVSGEAPFTVVFSIDGTNATAWSLELGDGTSESGDSFPAEVTHTYEAGTFAVNLTVTGDGGETVESVQVVVEEAVPVFPFEASASVTTMCNGCDTLGILGAFPETCTGWAAGENGLDCVWFELPAGADGHPFALTSTGGDPDLAFQSSCDFGSDYVGGSLSSGPESGTVPAGSGCIVAWEFQGATGSTLSLIIN